MDLVILFLFFIVALFFRYNALRVFKSYVNPLSVLIVVVFFHNFSELFSSQFIDVSWYVPVNRDDSIEILYYNLFNFLVLCFSIIFSFKLTKNSGQIFFVKGNFNVFYKMYLFLTIFLILDLIINNKLSLVYGINQKLTSQEAFSPFATILNARVPFFVVYFVGKSLIQKVKIKKLQVYFVISLELLITVFTAGRKPFVIICSCILMMFLIKNKKSIFFYIRYVIPGYILLLSMSILTNLRRYKGEGSTIDNLQKAYNYSIMNINNSLFNIIKSADMTSVQAWTYSLIESGELKLSLGKTYIQAFVNMFVLRPFQGGMVDWQAAYVFKYVAYPELTNHGYDFTFAAESFLNFGSEFSFVSYLVLGLFLGYVYKKSKVNDYYLLLNYVLLSGLVIHFRTDSTAYMRYVSFFIIVFFIFKKIRILKIEKK